MDDEDDFDFLTLECDIIYARSWYEARVMERIFDASEKRPQEIQRMENMLSNLLSEFKETATRPVAPPQMRRRGMF